MASYGSEASALFASQAAGPIDGALAADSTSRRIVQMQDWAPAQEAMFPGAAATLPIRPAPQGQSHTAHPTPPRRLRSMSVSLPWRQRPKSAFLEPNPAAGYPNLSNLSLEKSKSHGFGGQEDTQYPPSSSKHTHGNFKRMLRRASISLKSGVKGFIQRRTSVPAATAFDSDGQPARPLFAGPSDHAPRPTTSSSTWHRLRQATSFHRHSRVLYTGYGEHTFEHDLGPIESPTLPVPGSLDQPPIIPRNTGAAARQAAAIACNGMHGYDVMDTPFPRPGWLAEDALDDHESGIGIALTSSEMEAYVPGEEVDSDVDVDSGLDRDETAIIKIDFISELPLELTIQILALLDAPTLNTASRVCSGWYNVIRNQHIWRESFLREKTTTYATSGPVKPGTGLGVPTVRPTNDWKEIYRVKTELDERWKEGKARPVYLNGHTDSIYCLQFDEYATPTRQNPSV
jgi:F-box and WD-40 domain protein 1/11